MADRNGYIGRAPGDNPVIIARQTYNPTGVQTNFTFDSGYTPGYLDVYLNGVKLVVATDYTATDTSIVGLTSAAQNGDILEFVAYKAFDIASVGTAEGNFTVGTDLTVTRNATIGGDATVTGDISGRNFTGVAATFTGNVTVGGILTYEDVTSVDSLGILTARTGVHVLTGGVDVDAGGLNVVGVTTLTQLTSGPAVITGISTISNVTGTTLNATGVSTFSNVVVGGATTELVVTGDARVTGILTVGTASLTLNGTTGAITGGSLTNAEVAAISSEISDTAVDVFVYDTRKDSDGGAWRKRTQHTSWYNETLSTATRGSRKEFPAVAVIVAETGKVTIYDGDDPDLPMWMVFNGTAGGASHNLLVSTGTFCLSALNGTVFMGALAIYVNFISEYSRGHRSTGSAAYWNGPYNGNIAERNAGKGSTKLSDKLIAGGSTDVAMTVLPNAPIDSATGLPVPTIAVATGGGVSVIKDDGTVVDAVGTTFDVVNSISFDKNNRIICSSGTDGTDQAFFSTFIIPSSDISHVFSGGDNAYYRDGYGSTDLPWYGSTGSAGNHSINEVSSYGDYISFGTEDDGSTLNPGLKILSENITTPSEGMLCGISTSYNTGWMHGDIKGAFLSGISTTSVTASTELVTNGTFDSDVSGWGSFNSTLALSSNQLEVTRTNMWGFATQEVTMEIGKKYVLTADARTNNSSYSASMGIKGSIGNVAFITDQDGTFSTTMESISVFFTATQVTGYIHLSTGNSSGAVAYFDNVSLTEIKEEDRSVNDNGLQVFGTITKSAVATGADLVAYSGFSASNYLLQPYNSDLDFGTGDFCYMCWVKDNSVSAGAVIFQRGSAVNSNETTFYIDSNRALNARVRTTSNVATTSANVFAESAWNHCVFLRRSGIVSLFHNGIEVASVENTQSADQSGEGLSIGAWLTNNSYFVTAISLFKVSASAPSPEQIKKIYEDEKVLFQENANATLYGSSDAVTALAFDEDTNLLHVGTSSGRSDFQGLRRINNTTTAVTTAISASNGLVAEE